MCCLLKDSLRIIAISCQELTPLRGPVPPPGCYSVLFFFLFFSLKTFSTISVFDSPSSWGNCAKSLASTKVQITKQSQSLWGVSCCCCCYCCCCCCWRGKVSLFLAACPHISVRLPMKKRQQQRNPETAKATPTFWLIRNHRLLSGRQR